MDPDEKALEAEANQQPKMEEIRTKVIEDFGFDPEADKERIEKIVTERVEGHKKLSKAVQQKIKHRTDADTLRAAQTKKPEADPSPSPAAKKKDLTSRDTIAIINAKVHDDDIDEVVEYAAFKGIPLAEALKHPVVKATLAENQEARDAAEATNTGRNRGGNATVTGESLLEKAQKDGSIPEKEGDLDKMLDARYKSKR